MNTLVSAFWGEGISDERFLPVMIQRTLEALMLQCAQGEWEILEPLVIHPDRNIVGFVNQVQDLAQQAHGFHLLFIHTDADAPEEAHKAIRFKINPAIQAVQNAPQTIEYCREIIPVIPVVKIENWKLSDSDALREALATELDDTALGLNLGTKQLEQKSDAKELLATILSKINENRRIPVLLDDLDGALAKGIHLQKIYRFQSFERFVNRLKTSLIAQNILKADCNPRF
ncbi:MAG: DUF4276 family protein [Chitinophagales bacterium]|nr:DUF4276 family protein [Chitinophagales bacterium]